MFFNAGEGRSGGRRLFLFLFLFSILLVITDLTQVSWAWMDGIIVVGEMDIGYG